MTAIAIAIAMERTGRYIYCLDQSGCRIVSAGCVSRISRIDSAELTVSANQDTGLCIITGQSDREKIQGLLVF